MSTPEHGHVKINVDALVGKNQSGIGAVARDNHGNMFGCFSSEYSKMLLDYGNWSADSNSRVVSSSSL